MNHPLVSVLMPVFNGERYLKESINSILGQSFAGFEFIIIDDGSTDGSKQIVSSIEDTRIKKIFNEKNIGLIETLNKGILLAKGKYIARMDCDDIAYPERLKKQFTYLESHPEVSMIAANIVLIDAAGEECGHWHDDIDTATHEEITGTLPKTNCIAHPTVMIKTDIALKYKYSINQKGSEDWDLWMRMAADGHKFAKVNEPLLKYRIHAGSETALHNTKVGDQKKIVLVKAVFLAMQGKRFKFNRFYFTALYYFARSVARYIKIVVIPDFLRLCKRLITINPLKLIRDQKGLYNYLEKYNNSNPLFFFFPYTHTGGAEKVHADIVSCLSDKKPVVFFTGFSDNGSFLPLFQKNADIFNIPGLVNSPFTKKSMLNKLSEFINSQKEAEVFGCNSLFFYDLIPLLKKNIKCTELKHAYTNDEEPMRFERDNLKNTLRLTQRVFVARTALDAMKQFYRANGVDLSCYERLVHINNFVNVADMYPQKKIIEKLKVLYVGRGAPEKRVHLIGKIAEKCHNENIHAHFVMVGNVKHSVNKSHCQFLEFTGELTDEIDLHAHYMDAHILLLTSYREGFPKVIMEAMACGTVPVSTGVGDMALHITDNENGFITPGKSEEDIINNMVRCIKLISEDTALFTKLSHNAYRYAKENFGRESFCKSYRELFNRSH